MGRNWGTLDRCENNCVISKFRRNSFEMIASSCGVSACRCEACERDIHPYVGICSPETIALFGRLHRPPGQANAAMSPLFARFSFSAAFRASSYSGSWAIWNRAFFWYSDRCLIVPSCFRSRNRLIQHSQIALRAAVLYAAGCRSLIAHSSKRSCLTVLNITEFNW